MATTAGRVTMVCAKEGNGSGSRSREVGQETFHDPWLRNDKPPALIYEGTANTTLPPYSGPATIPRESRNRWSRPTSTTTTTTTTTFVHWRYS